MQIGVSEKSSQLETIVASCTSFMTTAFLNVSGVAQEVMIAADIQLNYVQLRIFRYAGLRMPHDSLRADTLSAAFATAAGNVGFATLYVDSIDITAAGDKMPPKKQLHELTKEVWCEYFKHVAESGSDSREMKTIRAHILKNTLWQHLIGGPAGIARWNAHPQEQKQGLSWQRSQLARAQLTGAHFTFLNFTYTNFDAAQMNETDLGCGQFDHSTFRAASLVKADCGGSLEGADFTDANLMKAKLKLANLENAIFKNADLSKANLRDANIRGVDLSTCKLKDAQFHDAQYDETTVLPVDFPQWSQLQWHGSGPDPYKQRCQQAMQNLNLSSFEEFIKYLRSDFDRTRLDKVIEMLKQESFQLFSEITEQSVSGIVKSQTDPDLIYGCVLESDGSFSCCTQNMKNCGGLKGALCKHILVLLIGLTKAGQIDLAKAARWVLASKTLKPAQSKEKLISIFLRYPKGADAIAIDWRPTQTLPEDYYAF